MEQDPGQLIAERINSIPQDLRGYLFGAPWRETLKETSNAWGLSEEQEEYLKLRVFLVLCGLDPVSNFRTELGSDLKISYDQVLKIAAEINDRIFKPNEGTLKQAEAEIKNYDEGKGFPVSTQSLTTDTSAENLSQRVSENLSATLPQKPEPVYFIPDHNQMEKTDGPHLHSQNIMPSSAASVGPIQSSSNNIVNSQPKAPFKSIVDQKLSGIVRSASSIYGFQKQVDHSAPAAQNATPAQGAAAAKGTAPTQASTPLQSAGYKGADPYREPIE